MFGEIFVEYNKLWNDAPVFSFVWFLSDINQIELPKISLQECILE